MAWLRIFYRRRGLLWRGLLAWMIGVAILWNDDSANYDQRFQIRGPQTISEQIVIIKVNPSEMGSMSKIRAKQFSTLTEIADITDSFYWDRKIWSDLLGKILAQNPQKLGVLFFFGDFLGPLNLDIASKKTFFDERVVWGTVSNQIGRPATALFAADDRRNLGLLDLSRDPDLVIRRFTPPDYDLAHMITRLSGKTVEPSKPLTINYRGDQNRFETYSLSEVLDDAVPLEVFKDKIVLIGPDSNQNSIYLTPQGPSHRAALFANILENALQDQWIKRLPLTLMTLGLFLLMLISIVIMTQYPQMVAFIFLFWMGTLLTALSIWVFDTFNIWIPILSAMVQIAATYVIFLGYQANKIERMHWILQQEKNYQEQLEQLKSNFISLISHDLKTPIAKIQGILNRQLAQDHSSEIKTDLVSLKRSSDELYRYIQSILQVLRVESKDFHIQREVGDINEVVVNVIDSLKTLAEDKKLKVLTDLEPMFSIEFDQVLIREVILNLIENAIKYTPNGGSVTVKSHESDSEVFLEVVDTGEGIAKEEIPLIWGKFVRGKDQDLRSKGTGLGLYLVKYFVELHGGRVWIESEINRGTTVAFSLPINV